MSDHQGPRAPPARPYITLVLQVKALFPGGRDSPFPGPFTALLSQACEQRDAA